MDGSGWPVFVDELFKLYRGEALPELAFDQQDYAVWQAENVELCVQEAAFRDMFADGVPENEMPTHVNRPAVLPFAALFSAIQANLLWLCYAASGSCTFLVLLVLVRRIQRKENVQGLLVIREKKGAIHKYDFTIAATAAEAVRLSERVMELSGQIPERAELIRKIALAMEEMVVCIAHYAHAGGKTGQIDLLVYVTDHQVLIQLRDNGTAFNALDFIPEKNDGCITNGIQLVKALSAGMEFSRRLGLNTIALTFENSVR